jgi:antitoxin VapB
MINAADHQEKVDRIRAVAREAGLDGVVLAGHHNIAWLTGGRGNRVDASREIGTSRILIAADGRLFVLANAIEMPRMLGEVLSGFDYTPIEYPWVNDQDASFAVGKARDAIKPGATLGADWTLPDTKNVEPSLMRSRVRLTDADVKELRALGRDAGSALGEVARALRPGDVELDIARRMMDAAQGIRARAIVALVGADERLRRFRHPVPTGTAWRHVVMMALCAERHGLIVSLSRIVASGGAPADLDERTTATASVFGRVLQATRAGATAPQLYATFASAYAEAGYPGEELKHHQGGAIGYRAREWVAHPKSAEVVHDREAFAWNPTITGTKIEDTALVIDGGIEIVTATPGWPTIDLEGGLKASGVWRL